MGSETALVVIDIQQFYFEGGLVPLTGSVEAASQARKVLEAFRARKFQVFHVRHVPKSVGLADGEPADPQYRIRRRSSRRPGNLSSRSARQQLPRDRPAGKPPPARHHAHRHRRHADAHVRRGREPGGDRSRVRGGRGARRVRHPAPRVRRPHGAGGHGARRRAGRHQGTYGRVVSVDELLRRCRAAEAPRRRSRRSSTQL